MNGSRIVVICHPNPSRIDFVLNTKRFNDERFSHSREKPATGHEERLLKRLKNVFGVEEANTSKSTLDLTLEEGFLPREVVPKVIELLREFAGPDHAQEIYLEERREHPDYPTTYDSDGWRSSKGRLLENADIGVPYKVWDTRLMVTALED